MKVRGWTVVALAALIFSSCAGSGEGTGDQPPSVPPRDFTVEILVKGAGAGEWSGYKIDANGTVKTFAIAGTTRTEMSQRQLDAGTLRTIWQEARNSKVFDQDSMFSDGASSHQMTVIANRRSYVYSWTPPGPKGSLTASLEKLFRFCVDAVRRKSTS